MNIKTNQTKETMQKELTLEVKEVNRQIAIIKDDLVNDIDVLFYDIGIIVFVSNFMYVGLIMKYQQILWFYTTFPWSLNRPDNN